MPNRHQKHSARKITIPFFRWRELCSISFQGNLNTKTHVLFLGVDTLGGASLVIISISHSLHHEIVNWMEDMELSETGNNFLHFIWQNLLGPM